MSATREAIEADLPRLLELLSQLSPDAPPEEYAAAGEEYRRAFEEVRGDRRQRLFVLEQEGRIVATAVLVVLPNVSHRGRPYALVENVVVDADARRGGHGARLLAHIIEQAKSAGCYKITLTSNKRRSDAHRFYEGLGFTATSEGFRLDL